VGLSAGRLLDALDLQRVSLVGNKLRWRPGAAPGGLEHPERLHRLAADGGGRRRLPLTKGLDAVWGYEPSVEKENMRRLLDIFAYNRELVTDELAELRYRASVEGGGVQESFSAMFPAPRQRWVEALATPEERIAALPHETLIVPRPATTASSRWRTRSASSA